MSKPANKNGAKKRRLWLALILSLLLIYLGYYQLWHRSPQVNSNIYTLDTILNTHVAEIWSVDFSPNGNWVASGSVDSTVKIRNRENGKIILSIKQPEGITSIDFSPDGNYLATASYDAKVRLWKLPEGSLAREFIGHKGTVWSVAFSPDGKAIASAGEDATIKLWNIETGRIERTFQGHTRNIWDVQFSPDGNEIASGSFDKTVRIWNLTDGKMLHMLTRHTEAVVAIAYSPDGKKLATTSDDKTIKLWNTDNWSVIYSLEVPEHNQAADFSPDNKLLVTAGKDKAGMGELLQNIFGNSDFNKGVSMRLWDTQTGKLLQTFSKHSNDVNDVAFSPDGKWIAGASSDYSISFWRISKQ